MATLLSEANRQEVYLSHVSGHTKSSPINSVKEKNVEARLWRVGRVACDSMGLGVSQLHKSLHMTLQI
jgi:hypothetical protein